MEYIFIGLFGFIAMFLFDMFSMKSYITLKYLFGFSGIAIITVCTTLIILTEGDYSFSNSVKVGNFLFLVINSLLLVYSVFLEVGLKTTYSTDATPKLVTNGTYALTRHPGVLWLFLIFVNLFFVFGNSLILYTGITWSIMNIVYVIFQEKYIFKNIFQDYHLYQINTPMIIPNVKSIRTTIKKDNWRKE